MEDRAQYLLESPALRKYRTRELTLGGTNYMRLHLPLKSSSAEAAVTSLKGIVHFLVIDWPAYVGLRLESNIFSLPSLNGM